MITIPPPSITHQRGVKEGDTLSESLFLKGQWHLCRNLTFLRTILDCFPKHQITSWRSSNRIKILWRVRCEAQPEVIIISLVKSNHPLSSYSQFDHNGLFGPLFGYFIQPDTNSFDGYFNIRQAFCIVWFMVSTCKNCSWLTNGSSDDDSITSMALHLELVHTIRVHSTVEIDAESIFA